MPLKSDIPGGLLGDVSVATGKTLKALENATIRSGTATLTLSDGTTDGGTGTATWFKVGSIVMVVLGMYSKATAGFNTAARLKLKGLPFAAEGETDTLLFTPAATYPIMAAIPNGSTDALLFKPSNAIDVADLTLAVLGLSAGNQLSIFGVLVYNASATA